MGQKEGKSFHVTMGAHDGAEICESIGVFMLSLIEKKKKKKKSENIWLYRDDGLSIFRNQWTRVGKNQKAHTENIQRKKMLDVIIECKMKIVKSLWHIQTL